jgi:hypothetical protein
MSVPRSDEPRDDGPFAPDELPRTTYWGYWREQLGAHGCDQLDRAIQIAVYEIVVTTVRGRRISRRKRRRRRVLVVVPNLDPAALRPRQDRIRWCPYCGARVRLVDAPPRRRGTPEIPEGLPPEIGAE